MPVPRPFRPFLRPGAAPLGLLLAALSSVFLFGDDRGHFYRPGHHDYVSAEHMAIVANLSPAHRFLMFRNLRRVDPPRQYNMYNRFPLGGYALIALTTSPFRGDLSLRLHAARMLTLGFFAAAAVLAYLALSRLAASRWTALTATLLAFSSYYCLYYNDMIHPEVVPGLFGVLLTFHGVVVFLQDGRFRQLLVKTCAALLLAWHVLALVAALVVLALARELRARSLSAEGGLPRPRHCLTLGAVSLLLFASLLTFNFVNEYNALDGTRAWTDLPSVNSMKRRTGFNRGFHERFVDQLAWRPFLEEQFRRIGTLSIPWALLRGFESDGTPHRAGDDPHPPWALAAGVVMTAAALAVLPFVRGRFPAAVLVLSGFCWSLPMRHQTAFHDYYVLFHVGVPLVVFAAAAAGLRRLAGDRAAVVLSAAALAVFVQSSRDMSGVGNSAEAAREDVALMSDFESIRRMTAGHPVYLPVGPGPRTRSFAGGPYAQNYFLAGSVLHTLFLRRPRPCHPGFVVTRERVAGATLLTPDNQYVFLYDRGDYDRNTARDAGAPDARPRRGTDCSHLGRPSEPVTGAGRAR